MKTKPIARPVESSPSVTTSERVLADFIGRAYNALMSHRDECEQTEEWYIESAVYVGYMQWTVYDKGHSAPRGKIVVWTT